MKILFIALTLMLGSTNLFAMSSDGCGAGSCADCHSISKQEVSRLLGNMVDEVNTVEFAEVPGMWVADVKKDNKKLPVFIDFSKQYLISGNVIRLADKTNVTRKRAQQMHTVDINSIPLADALLMGSPNARHKAIVFTDPECPYCKKLHDEMKEVIKRAPDIAFLIKLFPLPMHPEAHGISQSIVCNNSMEYLELSFAGKPVPAPNCQIPVVDETIEIGKKLGVRSTPTIILPDGLVIPGYRPAEALLAIIKEYREESGK
jgi:thiol:disulfide interchange protein DsbC